MEVEEQHHRDRDFLEIQTLHEHGNDLNTNELVPFRMMMYQWLAVADPSWDPPWLCPLDVLTTT